MKTTFALLLLTSFTLAACSREQPAADGDDANPNASASAATSPEADLRSQVGDLMRGEGLRPGDPAVALDARPLAGQAEMGVRALLGEPIACEDVAGGRSCRYARGATQVRFIDGMADGITVNDLGGAPFSAAALERVGLPAGEDPIESTAEWIRWQNLGGYREVTLHAGPGGQAARIEMKLATL